MPPLRLGEWEFTVSIRKSALRKPHRFCDATRTEGTTVASKTLDGIAAFLIFTHFSLIFFNGYLVFNLNFWMCLIILPIEISDGIYAFASATLDVNCHCRSEIWKERLISPSQISDMIHDSTSRSFKWNI